MFIAVLSVEFYFPGSSSLKAKRQRLRSLKEKFGRVSNIAVCENAHQDNWQRGSLSFLVTAADKKIVESTCTKILQHAEKQVDGEIANQVIEWL